MSGLQVSITTYILTAGIGYGIATLIWLLSKAIIKKK
jgi:hypothetical protein